MEDPAWRVRCNFKSTLMGGRSLSTPKTSLIGRRLERALAGASLACKMSAIKSAGGGCVPIGGDCIMRVSWRAYLYVFLV